MEDFSYLSSDLIIVHKEDNRELSNILEKIKSEEKEKLKMNS